MKHSTSFWILAGIVPSVVVAVFSAYAAKYFLYTQDTLFLCHFFIILLTLAVMAVTIFTVYALVAFTRSSYQQDKESVRKLSLAAWLNIGASIIIGVICCYGASRLGLSLLLSCTIGILAFIGYLLGPIAKDIAKQMREELTSVSDKKSELLPVVAGENESQTLSEDNPDAVGGNTIINTDMISNLMDNVVVKTPQAEATPSDISLYPPPYQKIEVTEPSKDNKPDVSADAPTPVETATMVKDEENKEPVGEQIANKPVQAVKIPESDSTPADSPKVFPKELSKYPIKVIFQELVNEQILKKDFKLEKEIHTVDNIQIALLADLIATWFGIKNKWKVFEDFWGIDNMAQSYQYAKKLELDRSIYNAIVRAHENPYIKGIKVITEWIKSYEERNIITKE